MFTQNAHSAVGLTREQKEESYFRLYYQFLKHAFGLIYSNSSSKPVYLRIYMDQLPDTKAKAERFKNYIYSLQSQKEFINANIRIRKEDIVEVDGYFSVRAASVQV